MESRLAAPIRYLTVWSSLLALLLLLPSPARATFDLSRIGEVMTSYDGDPNAQFVEISMLALLQKQVSNTVLAAFDVNGNYSGDVLVVPSNVPNAGAGVTWLMGTAVFQTVSGLTADFTIPPTLPTGGGMICWGAPGTTAPVDTTWSRTDFLNNYVDCVAYGTYAGPSNVKTGTPTPLNADGHGLERTALTGSNDADFACADPATPTNNAGASASLAATTACPVPPVCGNNIQEPGEACDGTDDDGCCFGGGYFGICTQCRSDCTCEFCGNAEIGPGEQCDDSSAESSPCFGSCDPVVCQCEGTDTDGDGSADFEDECTAPGATASDPPIDPPDQSPIKAKVIIKDLDKAADLRDVVARGFFNPATETPSIDPAFLGVHVKLTIGSTTLLDLGIPGNGAVPGGYAKGAATCGDKRDGWKHVLRPSGVELWKYTNRSGLLPAPGDDLPNCTGDAKGIRTVLIKFIPAKQSYLYLVTTKDHALDAEPPEVPPGLTELKFNLSLSVPPAPGLASEQAQAGQCVDSAFRDDGSGFVSSGPPLPFCKRAPKSGPLQKIVCRGHTQPTP